MKRIIWRLFWEAVVYVACGIGIGYVIGVTRL